MNKSFEVSDSPTSKEVAVPFFLNVNFCPVLNGWSGRYIALVGIGTSVVVSPTV